MNMQKYSTTDARANFSDILNKVKYQKIIVEITRNNQTEAFIVPAPQEDETPISDINAASSSFDWLEDEPNIYNLSDLKEKYV